MKKGQEIGVTMIVSKGRGEGGGGGGTKADGSRVG